MNHVIARPFENVTSINRRKNIFTILLFQYLFMLQYPSPAGAVLDARLATKERRRIKIRCAMIVAMNSYVGLI